MTPSIRLNDMAVVQNAENIQRNGQGTVVATAAIARGVSRVETVQGLRTRLDCRPQCRQQCGSLSLGWRAPNVCSITLLNALWSVEPSLSMLSSVRGRTTSSGNFECSSCSLVCMRSSSRASALVDSGEAHANEQLWEEYFSDPSQWWDNRADKRNPRSSDFTHKASKKALLVDDWITPPWVKARLKLTTKGMLQAHADRGNRDLEDTALGNGSTNCNHGNKYTLPTTSREVRLSVPSGGRSMQKQRACSTNEPIANLKLRLQQGLAIDSYMYVDVLKWCLRQKDLSAAKQVHDCIVKSGMDQNHYVAIALMNVYIGCGSVQDARRVFDELEQRNVVTWTIMIGGYTKNNLTEDALIVFNRMPQAGVQPNAITYLHILKACASPSSLKWVKEVHTSIRLAGLESDVRVGTTLVGMYAKCGCITEAKRVFENLTNRNLFTWNVMLGAYATSGSIDDARLLFDRMEERDVITWTRMIGAYAENARGVEAYRLLLRMQREGFKPNAITYLSILNASASAGDFNWVKELHAQVRKARLESDLRVGNAMAHMYAKTGSVEDAREVFNRMEKRDVISWNIMIGAYAESGRGVESYRLFLQMKWEGFKPNAITFVSILNAAASAGAMEWVKEVHGHVLKAGLDSDLRVSSALVHMYAKTGSIDDARRVFDGMEKRDVITWNIMIGGLAQHGCGHEALHLFRKMIADCVEPDGSTFVAVLSACCHTGLLDEGRRTFSAMTQDYGIEPTVVHYTCLVDLLGRAGHLEEAKLVICDMPVEPDGAAWGALLGACRIHGNVELGELAAREFLKLEPKNACAYVLLSNIYAAAGKWEKVSSLRTVMQERGVRKEPGRSWIEVDNKIHNFCVRDTSHPEANAIYLELNKLTEKLKVEGYIPDTQLVLQNIGEEDKELALCSHSEKLAIAYGLMHTPPGKPIRVYKNLRVCSDCHTATKFISKVTGREIIARDANRFHHFRGGVCSCGDYW